MKRKVAERKAAVAASAPLTKVARVAAGGIVGAAVGKAVGRTKRSVMAGAAIGAGSALLWPSPALEVPELVTYLQRNLGPRTTAYLSGVDDVGLVGQWGKGDARPDELSMQRLQSAYLATRYLVEAYDAQTARSWFMGMNPGFDDEAPARVLRQGQSPVAWEDVVLAAREFAET